jgi:hypothetical protein
MIYLIILLAIIARFIPHMPNFAPITALAIFSGANLGWKKSVGLTLAVRFISDIFLGFFSWPLMVAVYASHLVGVLFGVWITKVNQAGQWPVLQRWSKIGASSLFASVIFFLVTNFAFLYSTYDHTWVGIVQAYTNGLPFFRGTLLGDLGYSIALFGAYDLAKYFAARKSEAKNLASQA